MATILKVPSQHSKGVLILTTPERDQIVLKSNEIRKKLEILKENWIIGLHHNWHDYKFNYDSLFDFSMAGEEDLREKSNKKFTLIDMDACNFVPDWFKPSTGEKFWDVLYIARAVYFKKIPEFFNCIKKLYASGKKFRVLFICPVPPYNPKEKRYNFYDIRKVYDRTFTEDEKNLFNLLTLDFRYPYPFDLETLAYFYKSSKIFVHFANDERRCRVASYAWACGIPVVGMSCIGSLLPSKLTQKPIFYEVKKYEEFPREILKALKCKPNNKTLEAQQYFLERNSQKRLFDKLAKNFPKELDDKKSNYLLKNLSIRLGRHHGLGDDPNNLKLSLGDLLDILFKNINIKQLDSFDPECSLEKIYKRKGIFS